MVRLASPGFNRELKMNCTVSWSGFSIMVGTSSSPFSPVSLANEIFRLEAWQVRDPTGLLISKVTVIYVKRTIQDHPI